MLRNWQKVVFNNAIEISRTLETRKINTGLKTSVCYVTYSIERQRVESADRVVR